MFDFFRALFDTSAFPARWHCGTWTALHGWTHIVADLLIFGAYMAIPLALAWLVLQRKDIPFPRIFWLFVLFIMSCGVGHGVEALMFWWPAYRLSASVKVLTAMASWLTVFAIVPAMPRALRLPNLEKVNRELSREVAERRRAEAASDSYHQRLRLAMAAANMCTMDWDIPNDRISWSDEAISLLKLTPTGSSFPIGELLRAIHDEDRAQVTATIQAASREGAHEKAYMRFRFHRGDGQLRWLECHAHVLRDPAGTPVQLMGILMDITERRRLEERFQKTVESAPTAMIMIGGSGKIELVNTETEELFGYRRDELLGKDIELLVPERFRSNHMQHRKAFFAKPEARMMGAGRDLFGLRKDGTEFPVEIGLNPIETEEGMFVLSAIVDLTERRRLEEQVLQNQKLESIGRLAGGVAHDFNNLLTGIIGYAELATMKMGEPGSVKYVDGIRGAAERGASLVQHLLAFARKQIIRPRVVDLNQLIEQIHSMLYRLLGEHIEIVVSKSHGLWRTKVDPGQFEQVLINLCLNARDAMPKGGRLVLETANARIGEAEARKYADGRAGEFVLLSVTDSGIGMDEQVLKHLFEPFFTTKAGLGAGLGLAMVYGTVCQNQGFIHVKSDKGRGTCFEIFLPSATGATDSAGEFEEPRMDLSGTETILVAEDEPIVRTVLQDALASRGYRLLVAENGHDALERARKYEGEIDLLISDVVMPKLNGPDLAAALRKMYPTLRVLYISGYTENAIVEEGRLKQGIHFLKKPFNAATLAAKVRETLDSPRWMRGHAEQTGSDSASA